jgi:hypothetical protein
MRIQLKAKTGLIIFTYNNYRQGRPLSFVSSMINFFQTWKLKNNSYTHTAQTIILNGKLFVIDSDVKGVIPVPFEKWKQGRARLLIFAPCVLTPETEQAYIDRAMEKAGDNYGYEDIKHWLLEQITGKFKGETNPEKADDNMICVYFTQYLYPANCINWWTGSPFKLQKRRFEYFNQGLDLFEGKPEDVSFS